MGRHQPGHDQPLALYLPATLCPGIGHRRRIHLWRHSLAVGSGLFYRSLPDFSCFRAYALVCEAACFTRGSPTTTLDRQVVAVVGRPVEERVVQGQLRPAPLRGPLAVGHALGAGVVFRGIQFAGNL